MTKVSAKMPLIFTDTLVSFSGKLSVAVSIPSIRKYGASVASVSSSYCAPQIVVECAKNSKSVKRMHSRCFIFIMIFTPHSFGGLLKLSVRRFCFFSAEAPVS